MSDLPGDGEESNGETEEAEIDADEGLDEAADDGEADEDEGPEGQEGDVDPPPRPRARDTITTLRRRAQEAERGLADVRREVAELRNARQQQPDPAAQAAQEAALFERWEQMAPRDAERERKQYYESRVGAALNQMRGQLGDQMDRASYEARSATDKARARLADRVEETIATLRGQGNYTINRETVFKYLLGEEVDRRRGPETVRQRRDGQRRIASQTTRPGNARGDAVRSRRPADDSVEAARERTKGVLL